MNLPISLAATLLCSASAKDKQKPAQQKHGRGKKAKKSSGEAFKQLPQPDKGMVSGRQPRHWHPRPSSDLFVESVLRTLNVPPYNPKFFSDFAGPSSNAAAPAPPSPPVYASPTAPAPSAPPLPVYASAPPAFPPAANNVVFGSMAAPAAATTMAAAASAATYEPQVSRGGTQTQQGPPPPPPVMQQDLGAAVAAGDGPFTGGMAAGASAAAATEAGVPPQHDGDASDKVAMLAGLLNNDFDVSGGSSSSLAAPDAQILAMVSDRNGLISGGEISSTVAASSMAPQDFDAAPDGASSKAPPFMAPDQDLDNASADQYEDNTSFPLDALLGDLRVPMSEFDDAQLGGSTSGGAAAAAHDAAATSLNGGEGEGGLVEAMFASDQHEDEDGILDALLGDLHGPIFEFDDVHLDAQLGGSSSTSGSGEDVIDLNDIDIPFDVWTFEMEDFMSPQHKNKNKNDARE